MAEDAGVVVGVRGDNTRRRGETYLWSVRKEATPNQYVLCVRHCHDGSSERSMEVDDLAWRLLFEKQAVTDKVAGVAVVEREGGRGELAVVVALSNGRVMLWESAALGAEARPVLTSVTGSGNLKAMRVVRSTAYRTECVVGTSDRGVGLAALDARKGTTACSFFSGPREDGRSVEEEEASEQAGGSLLQNVFGSFANRFQSSSGFDTAKGSGSGASSGEPSSCQVLALEFAHPFLVALDGSGGLWCWKLGQEVDEQPKLLNFVSLKSVCVSSLDLASYLKPGTRQGTVDEGSVTVRPLDATQIAKGGHKGVAVLALVQGSDNLQKVVVFVFGLADRGGLHFQRHVLLSDEWLLGSAVTLQLKLKVASDNNSFVIKGSDGHAIAFAGSLETATEVAAIHMNKFVWDASSFTPISGQAQFLFLMHDLTQSTLSRTLLDMCYNIVEALPKQYTQHSSSDPQADASGLLGALDIQLKDKLEQHFQFVSLLHSRGWLDMLDMKTAGKIVRAGEHIAALQCIKSKENLLQEQGSQERQVGGLGTPGIVGAGSGGPGKSSVSLELLQSIIREAGTKVAERSEQSQLDEPKQPWEVFYSKPLSSVLFLDTVVAKVNALVSQPHFEISKDVSASTRDIQVQNAILNVLSRTVTETLNAVESWIRAVDASCIPVLSGAFGYQEGYSWTSCPSLCDCLLALSRLCIHYHSQWKAKAPNMVPRLSIQLHSLITQYLSVRDAFLEATPEEEKLRNPQHFRAYVDSGEEILGALLDASYEEANHMIQDAVAELAEVHSCYGVLYSLCEKTNDMQRLYQYMRMVQPFATYAFRKLIEAKRVRDILELPPEFNESLCVYLQQHSDQHHQELLWLHLARMQAWGDCTSLLESIANRIPTSEEKQRHLALSKLCKLAQNY
ncbi:hypothetical protein HOP50_07g46550 [Chloropicon primus]|uniref:Uncharacterized protein n=1 Tax=Chloropicon primus TaxID=1764295 RepID=A0A5B8MR61_9CHLO|nr:hypothetical protein A3770_07p46330 [Chloropicon primus]UPR01333.1 hypothetical protein HOP50_07g46550 [Chloropicon primus]|eukprot:QDZ22115.1 hypothetical protein A3770_07p46330 [Chloropicon primus]